MVCWVWKPEGALPGAMVVSGGEDGSTSSTTTNGLQA